MEKLKLEIETFRFTLNKHAQEKTGFESEERVMFRFNFKKKKAYMIKDDESDYILRGARQRFTNKNLAIYFIDCFDLNFDKNNHYFLVKKSKKKKGYFKLIYVK